MPQGAPGAPWFTPMYLGEVVLPMGFGAVLTTCPYAHEIGEDCPAWFDYAPAPPPGPQLTVYDHLGGA